VTLPCRVKNKRGALQWTRDGFGLGIDRNLTGFHRYNMIGMFGSDEEGKVYFLVQKICCCFDTLIIVQYELKTYSLNIKK